MLFTEEQILYRRIHSLQKNTIFEDGYTLSKWTKYKIVLIFNKQNFAFSYTITSSDPLRERIGWIFVLTEAHEPLERLDPFARCLVIEHMRHLRRENLFTRWTFVDTMDGWQGEREGGRQRRVVRMITFSGRSGICDRPCNKHNKIHYLPNHCNTDRPGRITDRQP